MSNISISKELSMQLTSVFGGKIIDNTPNERKDFLDFELVEARADNSLINSSCDKYYAERGMTLAPLASNERGNFALRTYRHISGSSVQVMMNYDGNKFNFFINDEETERQKEIREALQEKEK